MACCPASATSLPRILEGRPALPAYSSRGAHVKLTQLLGTPRSCVREWPVEFLCFFFAVVTHVLLDCAHLPDTVFSAGLINDAHKQNDHYSRGRVLQADGPAVRALSRKRAALLIRASAGRVHERGWETRNYM